MSSYNFPKNAHRKVSPYFTIGKKEPKGYDISAVIFKYHRSGPKGILSLLPSIRFTSVNAFLPVILLHI